MATGDITLNLIGNNQLSGAIAANVSALGGLDGALDRHIGKLVQQTRTQQALRNALNDTDREQTRGIQITGRQQAAIGQLVFAVDDATTVFGQQGWAGAIRAASNNLTAAASLMGPWAAAIAVGVSAVVQLGLAMSDNEKKSRKSKEALSDFRKEAEAIQRTVGQIGAIAPHETAFTADAIATRSNQTDRDLDIATETRNFLAGQIAALEQRQTDFLFQNTTSPNDPLRGLSEENRTAFDQMTSEIDDLEQKMLDASRREQHLIRERRRLQEDAAALQDREAANVQANLDREAIQFERRQRAEKEAERKKLDEQETASRDIARQIRGDFLSANPFSSEEGQQFSIFERFRERERQINSLTGVAPSVRADLLADAETVAARQLGATQRDRALGLSGRGPSTLRTGEAETFRFLAQARLGASAQTPEVKKLAAIDENGRAILAELRKQTQFESQSAPTEVVDF